MHTTNIPHTEGTEEAVTAADLSHPAADSILAQLARVPSVDKLFGGSPLSNSTLGQPPEELSHADVSPQAYMYKNLVHQ